MAADTFPSLNAPSWPTRLGRIGLWLIVVGLIAAALSGPATRFGVVSFRIGLPALGVGFLLLVVGVLLALVGLIAGAARRAATARGAVALATVIALATIGYLLTWVRTGMSVPPIHEVSTDLDTPPPFVAIAPIRDAVPGNNPSAYVATMHGPRGDTDVRAAQRAAYPDLQPLHLDASPEQAFSRAEQAARKMGWELVATDAADGRIEATAMTRFFGFKDDVVVRVRPEGAGTRIDVRSKSRVGLGDAGTNAARVRAYLNLLRQP
jgi:uncharacterized protein (DUF1499 family)/energy-converting hydrogenase Eha subunit E